MVWWSWFLLLLTTSALPATFWQSRTKKYSQLCTGLGFITSHWLREIGWKNCVFFTYCRQVNAIFSPNFNQPMGSNKSYPSRHQLCCTITGIIARYGFCELIFRLQSKQWHVAYRDGGWKSNHDQEGCESGEDWRILTEHNIMMLQQLMVLLEQFYLWFC